MNAMSRSALKIAVHRVFHRQHEARAELPPICVPAFISVGEFGRKSSEVIRS